jgi:hypothetical protein
MGLYSRCENSLHVSDLCSPGVSVRHRSENVPRFSGRKIAKRLAPNSLFPVGLLPKGERVTYETAGDRPRGKNGPLPMPLMTC